MSRLHASVAVLLCSSCLFHFDRTLAPGELRGTAVIRSSSGALVAAANAVATLEGSTLSITADSHGVFAFEGLPAGTYSVDVRATSSGMGAADFGLHLRNIAIASADGADLGQIVLGAFGGLQGTVTLENTPVAAATVVIPGITQTPVTNGTYQLGVLLPGTYQLSVFLPDNPGAIESSLINVQVNPGKTTQVPTIALSQSELQTTGAAQGVAQLSGATSSADIDIQFSGAGPDLSTNPQGQYSGMNIPAGLYSVTASLGGFQSVTLSNIVIGGATTTIPMITLFPGSNPPADAGSDAGPVDAGEDAGPTDAGPSDAGPDAGPDAGATDAGVDAGEPDAGLDAGELDAGLDAGELDAGLDAGELDAGLDGGAVDGGALFPPGAPTNVMAVAGDGSATVTWTAPLDDGGDPILNYTVTSSPDGITVTVDGDQTNAQLTGLTDGTSYTFTVHATNAIGNSSESDPSAAVTPLGAPQAPFGVTAVAGDTVATVSWSAPLDDGGSPITGYTVTSTPGNMTATTSGATTVQVTGLIDGQSYTFTVHATNVIGDSPESAPSTAVTPLGPPSAPNGVMAVAGEMVATVTWSVPSSNGGSPITGYTVTAMPGSITASTTGATSAQVTGLTDGLSYTFTVHATNAIGNSPESTPTSGVIPMGPPLAPTGVSAVSGDTVATVSWTAPASDGGSMITSYTVTSTPDGITATANGDATSVQVTGLMDGTSYTFTVHATNAIGDSPESDPSTAVTPAGLPGAPTDVSAVFGNGSATVSWTPPASDGGSPITGYTVTSTPDGITASTTGATTVQVLGLTNGQSYTFTVHSTNSVGDSAESTPSTAVTPAGPPGAPTSVVAVAGPESATLTWNAPTDDGGSPVVTYTIIGEPGDVTAMTSASEPTAFVPELTDGVSYTFTVFATNAVGNGAESDPSAPVTPMGPPGAPLNVMAVAGDSVATVSWSAPASDGDSPITGYTVTTQPGGATTTTTDLSVQVTGLMDGQSYAFTVHATNSIGDGPESDPSNEVTPLYVDAGPPPPDPNVGQDDAGNAIITYTRIPWGSAATAGVPSFSVSGVSGSAAGDYGVVIFDNPDAGANVLGSATVDDTGAFTAALTSLDHPSVYIAGVSDAGVLSPDLQEVQNVTWTATFGGKVPGVTTTNPHVLTTTGDFIYEQQYESFGGPLVPDGLWAREASSYAGVTAPDDGQVLTEDAVSTVWTNLTPGPGDRWGASSAFDSTAKNLVLFGGCAAGDGCTSPLTDTWFWGGQTWTNVSAELNNSPTGRVSAAMSYDPIHQQLVLFGGLTWSGNAWTGLGDTWVLASGGNGWVNVTPSGTNPTASAAAMVYDTVHQVILLQTPDSATWTWDGSSWTSVSAAANGPSPQRTFPGLAFDSVRGVAVLFGGCGLVGSGLLGCANAEGGLLNDTWVWDGTAWTQVATGNLPNQRAAPAMAFDPGRGVTSLVGGVEAGGNGVVDNWDWDGSNWIESLTETSLPGRFLTNLVYDSVRSSTILLGGCTTLEDDNNPCEAAVGDVWMWDGTNFDLLNLDGPDPGVPAGNPGMVYDTNQYVDVFFGPELGPTIATNDVYQLGYQTPDWYLDSPDSPGPQPRFNSAMVFDSSVNQTTLFGGYLPDGAQDLADTWTWNGDAWTSQSPTTSPPARHSHGMSFDSSRGTTVLFGGSSDGGVVDDTWEWQAPMSTEAPDGGIVETGGTWNSIGGTAPPARDQHMMTFDQAEGMTYMFGGSSDGTNANLTDTWQYTAAGWSQLSPATSPTARQAAAFVYDSTRGVDLLFGGVSNNAGSSGYNDLWEWDGTTWTSIPTTGAAPGVGSWSGAAYDLNFEGMLLAGGQIGSTSYDQTWLLTSDVTRVPLALAQFSFAAAGAVAPTITQMSFNVYAGGSGNTVGMPGRGTQVPGAMLGFWSNSQAWWVSNTSNTSLPAAPTQLTYTTGSAGEAQDYLYNPTQTINLAIIPTAGGRGNGLSPTEITVDYVEVTVSYVQASVEVVGGGPSP